MSFQIKKFDSIIASMVNWASSATDKITDFNVGSVIRTLLEAVAVELEELYYQLLKAVEEAIEEAIYRTFNFPKNPAERSTGTVTFTRLTGFESTITIPLGTLVSTDSAPPVYFETLAEATLPAITGTATGGGPTSLIDTAKDWIALGVNVGTVVKSVTDGGEATIADTILTGTAQAGSLSTKLVDTTRNFSTLGVLIGSLILNLTASSAYSYVSSITTTTNPNDTLIFAALSGGAIFNAGDLYEIDIPFYSTTTNPNDTLHFPALTGGASFAIDVPRVYYESNIYGTVNVSGPAGTSLTDTTKNFSTLGVIVGVSMVQNLTKGGAERVVVSFSTYTNPNDTVNFAAGTVFDSGDVYIVTLVPTDYTVAAQTVDTNYYPVSLQLGDYIYVGFNSPNDVVSFYRGVGVQQTSIGILSGEYWTGAIWSPLLYFNDLTKGVNTPFSSDGVISWAIPPDWTRKVYQTYNLYWVRLKSDANLLAGSQGDALQVPGDSYNVLISIRDASAQASEAGVDGNVAANSIIVLRTSIAGVNSVNNAAAFANGVEEETDASRKARFAYYIQSLARATKGALEYAARTVTQVVSALAIDDNRASVWKYYAITAVYSDITTSMRNPGDAAVTLFESNSPGAGAMLYFGGHEPFDYINFHFVTTSIPAYNWVRGTDYQWEYWDGVIAGGSWQPLPTNLVDGTIATSGGFTAPLVQNGTVSWTFNPIVNNWVAASGATTGFGGTPTMPLRMWIRFKIIPAGAMFTLRPTGDFCSLPPAFGYVNLYCHDGSGTLPASVQTSVEAAVELYRGCGITVIVLPPNLLQPTVNVRIWIAANYDMTEMAAKVRQNLIDWLSNYVLGEDLYVADIYHKIMGIDEKAILNCEVIAPTSDLIVPSSSVVRPNTSVSGMVVTPLAG
jgi:hypothetical protein